MPTHPESRANILEFCTKLYNSTTTLSEKMDGGIDYRNIKFADHQFRHLYPSIDVLAHDGKRNLDTSIWIRKRSDMPEQALIEAMRAEFGSIWIDDDVGPAGACAWVVDADKALLVELENSAADREAIEQKIAERLVAQFIRMLRVVSPVLWPEAFSQSAPVLKRLVTREEPIRDPGVVKMRLAIAGNMCEGCEQPAPFQKIDECPYLEVHHMVRLSEGGADTVGNTLALCPNCHREAHHGVEQHDKLLWQKLKSLK